MLIFTDGSFSKKPDIAGLGVVLIYNGIEENIGCYSSQCRDNNTAEIASIALAIQYIEKEKILETCKDKTVTIITDSSFALQKINYDTHGRDRFEQDCLDSINNFMNKSKRKINFMQVKGHIHDGTKLSYYNDIADKIAGEYRMVGIELVNEPKRRRNKHLKNMVFNKSRKDYGR
jgi:ribonuclease HI